MINLNNKWKIFKISEIFEVEKSKNITKEAAEEFLGNTAPYVTRSEFNNGIAFYVNAKKFSLEKGNCITIGGEGACVFYQPYKFISGNNINKLYSKFLDENNALFIVTILNLEKYRYSYNRAFNQACIKETKIKLPVNVKGQPDWNWMSEYIKKLRERESYEYSQPFITNKKIDLNFKNWWSFKIKNIFFKKQIKKYFSIPEKSGKIPFVTSSEFNNGITKLVDKISVYDKNAISVSTNGSCFKCFYQPKEFGVSSDVEILYNENLNKFNALFIITILSMETYRYTYGRKPKNNKVWDTIIKLPYKFNFKNQKVPDWEYMEDYIKSLPYSKYL